MYINSINRIISNLLKLLSLRTMRKINSRGLGIINPINSLFINLPDYTDGVGIDLGIKTLATVSDGTTIPNIKTFRRVRILNKRLKRLQRKVSRKYHINKCNKHNKTKNIIKLERQIKLIYRSLWNIRINHIRKFVSDLVKKQPQYIAIEDLNVKGMMKNKYLAKDIANCSFYTIREHLIRKATERHIVVRLVDRFYPSSKTCSYSFSGRSAVKPNHYNTYALKIMSISNKE